MFNSSFAHIRNSDEISSGLPTETGKDIIKKLMESHELNYQKKFPFDRGVFHQCLPNPHREKEFITVQIVNKMLV